MVSAGVRKIVDRNSFLCVCFLKFVPIIFDVTKVSNIRRLDFQYAMFCLGKIQNASRNSRQRKHKHQVQGYVNSRKGQKKLRLI